MIAASLIAIAALLFGAPTAPVSSARTLEIAVRCNAVSIEVTNLRTDDWRELVVYLNGMPPDAPKASAIAPAPGSSVAIPLSRFVDRAGRRFLPTEQAVIYAWIGGGGYNFARYELGR